MARAKVRRWAWLVPWVGASLAGTASEPVRNALGNPFRAIGVFFLFGLLLGWAWTRFYARPLVERIGGFALWACVIVALAFVVSLVDPGSLYADRTTFGSGVTWCGILVALVLVEDRQSRSRAL